MAQDASASSADQAVGAVISTTIAARLERLPWSRFHTLVVAALGITWILDGLEVTLAGSIAGALKASPALRFSDSDVGLAGTAYLGGAVAGALFFGWLTDRLGRKKLFFVTLATYLVATALTGLAWDGWSFWLFRFLTGAGIGGEYTAINSTIQEFVPARYRGFTDLCINGSFWLGAAGGAGATLVLLDPAVLAPDHGWRACFLVGAVIGLVVLFMRTWLPESPRWLVTHGHEQEADRIVRDIEATCAAPGGSLPPVDPKKTMRIRTRDHTPLGEVWNALFVTYRSRTFVGLALMVAQAFFYNAIFFTYALVLTRFYGVESGAIGWYILPFAASNFLGPVLLGRLFDTVGRRPMIALTYGISGVLLAITGILFATGQLTATTLTVAWMLVFFIASPAAGAAYLTVSETFPVEIRAVAIAIFYAIGTGVGGVAAPTIFGRLVESGSRENLCYGYLAGAALMIGAAAIAAVWAVKAEGQALESVAQPLSAAT